MRVLIITSCTGEKAVESEQQLTLDDFYRGPEHVATREAELAELMRPASELYTGEQHKRLMRGISAVASSEGHSQLVVDLRILSAGYGLVAADRLLAPYEATFHGMRKGELKAWANQLGVPQHIRQVLREPYDLALLLLGDSYLEACALAHDVALGGPTIAFCGANTARRMPALPLLRTVVLGNVEARRFFCGLVGLKGEVVRRLLSSVAADHDTIDQIADPNADVLALAETASNVVASSATVSKPKSLSSSSASPTPKAPRGGPRANPNVDRVISLPESWWQKPHRSRLRYFIPEWDDLVDPDYDFATDIHSGGSGDWSNEVYAHQMYPEPNYDGLLISKVIAEAKKKKKERINAMGVHRFLRVPQEFPIIGDCGAFGYIMEDVPPYSTGEILDYYTRLGFNYGVSIDHLVVAATAQQKRFRYELTINNAEDFLREHRARGLSWTPIGAVQGWDPQSYAEAARQYVAMGYTYIALGGLVRTTTAEIIRVLDAVHAVVPAHVDIHLFGIARLGAMVNFASRGVRSVDSASFLRRAWMGVGKNYATLEGGIFTAIRIPEAGKSFRAKRIVQAGKATEEHLKTLEARCLQAMIEFDKGLLSVDSTLDLIDEYDHLITESRNNVRDLLRKTLEARPWKECPCDICRKDGVQVIIFRGNNRNRRRGFHNTYVFYRLLQQVMAGDHIPLLAGYDEDDSNAPQQLPLFESVETL